MIRRITLFLLICLAVSMFPIGMHSVNAAAGDLVYYVEPDTFMEGIEVRKNGYGYVEKVLPRIEGDIEKVHTDIEYGWILGGEISSLPSSYIPQDKIKDGHRVYKDGDTEVLGEKYVSYDKASAILQKLQRDANNRKITLFIQSEVPLSYFQFECVAAYLHSVHNPYGGDVLAAHCFCSPSYKGFEYDGMYYYTVSYTVYYNLTNEQFEILQKTVQEILDSLDVQHKTDYEIIESLYDWFQKEVVYEATPDKMHEISYGALVNRKAICNGYAGAFYILALSCGIDARIIIGGGHAWNIVFLEGKWYLIDTTWGTDVDLLGVRMYFLNSEADFKHDYSFSVMREKDTPGYHRYKQYTISETSYKSSPPPTKTSKPTATAVPTKTTHTPAPTKTPAPTATIRPVTATPEITARPSVTPSPNITQTPVPTSSPTLVPTASPRPYVFQSTYFKMALRNALFTYRRYAIVIRNVQGAKITTFKVYLVFPEMRWYTLFPSRAGIPESMFEIICTDA